jgi:hypothetical protein
MPHLMFVAHCDQLEAIRAERLLDAAQAATAQFQKQSWWDGLLASARGVVRDVAEKLEPMFVWNGRALNSSEELRQKFAQDVSGSRVER